MTTTISTVVNHGITLASASQSPVTVTASGVISASGAYTDAIYAGADLAGATVVNAGRISGLATGGVGIDLVSATAGVTNGSGGYVYGQSLGVSLYNAISGALNNQGTIVGNDAGARVYGVVVVNGGSGNTGALIQGGSVGVQLLLSGSDYPHCVLTNYGTIAGGQTGVAASYAAISNFGTITGHGLGAYLYGSQLNNAGRILNGVQLAGGYDILGVYAGSTITGVVNVASGTTGALVLGATPGGTAFGVLSGLGHGHYDGFASVTVAKGARWQLGGVNVIGAGTTITNTNGGMLRVGHGHAYGALEGSGRVAGPIQDNGVIMASGGTLEITGNVTGTGGLSIGLNAELLLDGKVTFSGAGAHTIAFAAGGATLGLGATGNLAPTITGFGAGDQFDLRKAATGLSFAAGALTIAQGAQASTTLHLQGSFTSANFGIKADGHGGSDVFYQAAGAHRPFG